MAEILRGYEFSRQAARYRDTATGRFVSRQRITGLLEQQVNESEEQLAALVQALFAEEIAPGYAQTLMRDELRRLSLTAAALGVGGFARLTFADYGRAGRQLRDTYQRMTRLMNDVQSGRVSLAQALNRIEGYTLDARRQFFAAQREAMRQAGGRFEERRTLHARESCGDCVGYARMGWQPMDTLPLPGQQSRCGSYCRCTVEYREAQEEQLPQRAERIFA